MKTVGLESIDKTGLNDIKGETEPLLLGFVMEIIFVMLSGRVVMNKYWNHSKLVTKQSKTFVNRTHSFWNKTCVGFAICLCDDVSTIVSLSDWRHHSNYDTKFIWLLRQDSDVRYSIYQRTLRKQIIRVELSRWINIIKKQEWQEFHPTSKAWKEARLQLQ